MGTINWEELRREYESSDITLKELAVKYGISEGTMRSRKNREGWQRNDTKSDATQRTTKKQNVATQIKTNKKQSKIKKTIDKKEIKIIESSDLTEKQKLFCLYYVKNFNATQAYLKAYQSSYAVANVEGWKLLVNPSVKTEIDRLKELKRLSIMITEDDIVERHMRIAFADMTDFVEFGQEEQVVMGMFGPVEVEDPETGKKKPLIKIVNTVRFKDSDAVDGGLICQIKQGKDGASLKLEDRQKSLDWLSNFFGMNPQHKHTEWYNQQRVKLAERELNHKISAGNTMENAILESQQRITSLAQMIKSPLPDRKQEDFEDDSDD